MTSEIKPRIVYLLKRTDKSYDCTDIYVGSTSQPLKKRLNDHKRASKIDLNNKLYTRMRAIGIQNWEILPLSILKCDKETILESEKNWIIVLNTDLNSFLPLSENNNNRDKEHARSHRRNSLENRRYYCDVCNMAFCHIYNLKRHLNSKKHKEKSFEQLLENVHKMIQDGTFSQALENSQETYL